MLDRRTFIGIWAGGLLAMPLAAEAQTPRAVPSGTSSPWLVGALLPFLLVAGVVFLICTGVLVLLSRRRRRQKLAKILVPLVAGSVCGRSSRARCAELSGFCSSTQLSTPQYLTP